MWANKRKCLKFYRIMGISLGNLGRRWEDIKWILEK